MKLLSLIKNSLFLIYVKSCAIITKLKGAGVSIGKKSYILGIPYIQCPKGARITIGEGCQLISQRRFNPYIHYPVHFLCITKDAHIELGNGVGISSAVIRCTKSIKIGDKTLIGPEVIIRDNDGHYPGPDGTWPSSTNRPELSSPVVIEESCFIGARATILKGVTIGKGSVVGTGSVVTRDIPPYHLAYGNPAKCRPLPDNWKYQAPEGE